MWNTEAPLTITAELDPAGQAAAKRTARLLLGQAAAAAAPEAGRSLLRRLHQAAAAAAPPPAAAPAARLSGASAPAAAGRALFPSLSLAALPADYPLVFRASGAALQGMPPIQPGYLTLAITDCPAGAFIDAAGPGGPACSPCAAPFFSQDGRTCDSCPAAATCNGTFLIPDSGFWNSGPQSPQVHACLVAEACARSPAERDAVGSWARQALAANANGTVDLPAYNDRLCADNYQGPLCGACAPGAGHRDLRCEACRPAAAGRGLYFLAWLYTAALLALLLLLHRRSFACFRGVAEHVQNRLVGFTAKGGAGVDNYVLARALADDVASLEAQGALELRDDCAGAPRGGVEAPGGVRGGPVLPPGLLLRRWGGGAGVRLAAGG
jgi:hypothetical protein